MVQELLLQEQSDELDIGLSRRQEQFHLPLAMVTVTAIEVNFSVIGRLKSTSILAAFFFSTYIYDSKISLEYDRHQCINTFFSSLFPAPGGRLSH